MRALEHLGHDGAEDGGDAVAEYALGQDVGVNATPAVFAEAVKNGRYHFTTPAGQEVDVPWPPNLEILDGLLRCFERDYHTAMGDQACRKPEGS